MTDMDCDLSVTVSKRAGEGEDTMTSFIQQHIASILQPFADHLDELHRAVNVLTNDVLDHVTMGSENKTDLMRQHMEIAGLRRELHGNIQNTEDIQALLVTMKAENVQLQTDHGVIASRLESVDKRLHCSDVKVETLELGHRKTDRVVALVKASQEATDANIANNLQPALKHQSMELQSLCDAHRSTSSMLAETSAHSEAMLERFEASLKRSEEQNRRDKASFEQIDKTMTGLKSSLGPMDVRLTEQSDLVGSVSETVLTLRVGSNQLESMQLILQKHLDSISTNLADQVERAHTQQVIVSELVERIDDMQQKQDIGAVTKLKEAVSKHEVDIGLLKTLTEQYSGVLQTHDSHTRALVAGHSSLVERIKKVEVCIGDSDDGGNPRAKSPGSRWGSVRDNMDSLVPLSVERAVKQWSIAAGQQNSMARIDAQTSELVRTKSALDTTSSGLVATENRVKELEVQLDRTNKVIQTLEASTDLSQEYWSGLGRGLRQTHKAIAVDGDMLPAKGSLAVTLPALSTRVKSYWGSERASTAR